MGKIGVEGEGKREQWGDFCSYLPTFFFFVYLSTFLPTYPLFLPHCPLSFPPTHSSDPPTFLPTYSLTLLRGHFPCLLIHFAIHLCTSFAYLLIFLPLYPLSFSTYLRFLPTYPLFFPLIHFSCPPTYPLSFPPIHYRSCPSTSVPPILFILSFHFLFFFPLTELLTLYLARLI